jgi:DNA mismatch repair protein MutL
MTTQQTTTIELLPEHIIDQIKAGEVIERPSTLIKEIIENSIDANSTTIDIHLIENGLELISLIDNGEGINPQALPLAFCRHATSKITSFEDIYKLYSYGFRGEALASIASISKVTCETQTKNSKGLIKIKGGETLYHDTQSDSLSEHTGTKIFIRDLFYNTPVRMKFIQSKTAEKNQIKKILTSFLLTQPQISFSIKWDQQDKQVFPKVESLSERIQQVLFSKKSASLVSNQSLYDGVEFQVFFSQESTRGNAHKHHYLFINNRYVQDIKLHKMILNSADSLWPQGESGHYIAYLEIPADEIDVNIHPNKTSVKLFRAPKVYSIVTSTVKALSAKKTFSQQQRNSQTSDQLEFHSPAHQDIAHKIDYKQIDFSQGDEVGEYFAQLHQEDHQTTPQSLYQESSNSILIGDYFIFQSNEQTYLISQTNLLQFEFYNTLHQIQTDEPTVPLLISKPIKLKTLPKKNCLQFLVKLGFEVDQLDQKTVVIRAFPQRLQSFSYISLVEDILKNNISQLQDLDQDSLPFQPIKNPNKIIELINKLGISFLTQKNLIHKITPKDLRSIYENKK